MRYRWYIYGTFVMQYFIVWILLVFFVFEDLFGFFLLQWTKEILIFAYWNWNMDMRLFLYLFFIILGGLRWFIYLWNIFNRYFLNLLLKNPVIFQFSVTHVLRLSSHYNLVIMLCLILDWNQFFFMLCNLLKTHIRLTLLTISKHCVQICFDFFPFWYHL